MIKESVQGHRTGHSKCVGTKGQCFKVYKAKTNNWKQNRKFTILFRCFNTARLVVDKQVNKKKKSERYRWPDNTINHLGLLDT